MNPTFTVSVDLVKRKTSVTGLVAVGEKVNVVISGFGDYSVPEWEPDNTEGFSGAALRFRLVAPDGKDLVRFPLAEGDKWSGYGGEFSAEVDFNTMQLRKWLRGFPIDGKAEVGVIVDSVVDAMVYGRGTVKILQWAASPAEDPTILPDWRNTLRDLNAAIVEISSKTERADSAAQTAESARDEARTSKERAETAANNAASSRTAAESAKSAAESAKSAAEGFAESAKNTLANAATKAELQAEENRATAAEAKLEERVKELEENGVGSGSSVEVVPPSPDSAGKAADAKAVYEALEGKADKLSVDAKRDKADLKLYTRNVTFRMVSCTVPGHGYAQGSKVDAWEDDGGFHHFGIMDNETFVDIQFIAEDKGPGRYKLTNEGGGYELIVDRVDTFQPTEETLATSNDLTLKQDALNDGQMAAVNSGIDGEWVSEQMRQTLELQQKAQELQQTSTYQAGLIDRKIPLYTTLSPVEVDGSVHLYPFARNEVSGTLEAMTIAEVIRLTSDGSLSFASDIVLDCSLVIDCRGRETAPTITWGAIFHPSTDAETDFACVAGVRNVYWITEYAPGEFVVAGWQETTGGNAA
jgi:hypothetical protein